MAADLEKEANDAYLNDEFELAVDLFTKAISADPSHSASLLSNRAQAHIKLNCFTDAVADANRAIEMNPKLSKAYLRKGIACFHLDEYETAKVAFTTGSNLEPSNATYKKWIEKCDTAIAEEEANADSKPIEENLSTSIDLEPSILHKASETPPEAPISLPKPTLAFRHAFYQNANEVIVEIFAKGLKQEQLNVEFGVQLLRVTIDIPPNDPYVLQTRLNQKVVVEKCKYNILGTKVEIRLAKAEMLQWKTLEYDQNQTVIQSPKVILNTKLEYPSSSKKVHKDWDKLESEVKKEEKDEKLEGDAALNKLFREIYQNADEDTRRAMNKSFVESSGTVLSTNWKDVGKKYVEGSPPTGMEMKQWEK